MNNSHQRYQDNPEPYEEEEVDVRLKAFALLNRIGPTADDDASTWPEKPQPRSSYQRNETPQTEKDSLRRSSAPARYVNNNYEELGMAGLFVSCIADACKKSTEYAARMGYETIYPGGGGREAEGEFEKVNILGTYGTGGQASGEA
ncbi:expressed unknown protein [Seminavis robusta]|uniref:Uncharacterized protein n=1 Tax=Seminavis robusta TaxID=568900 RepID=A0A9N8ENT8_9STRA|nr:expressed unknown protein [Seminavis robusta]|eukprot:Sro1252_g256260.1 n/a (146) ;mRNA; r:15095-15532